MCGTKIVFSFLLSVVTALSQPTSPDQRPDTGPRREKARMSHGVVQTIRVTGDESAPEGISQLLGTVHGSMEVRWPDPPPSSEEVGSLGWEVQNPWGQGSCPVDQDCEQCLTLFRLWMSNICNIHPADKLPTRVSTGHSRKSEW